MVKTRLHGVVQGRVLITALLTENDLIWGVEETALV